MCVNGNGSLPSIRPVFLKVGGGLAPLGVQSHVGGGTKHEVGFAVVYLHNIND